MSLILVTGISGSGKSSVMEELRYRGFEAHGTDEHGLGCWEDIETGRIVDMPEDLSEAQLHEWFANNKWVYKEDEIKKLSQRASETTNDIYVCGTTSDEWKVWGYFNKIFALTVDPDTAKDRIVSRTNNSFGKDEKELADILKWHKEAPDSYRRHSAVLIDAARKLDSVVDDIIRFSLSF